LAAVSILSLVLAACLKGCVVQARADAVTTTAMIRTTELSARARPPAG
jgi:hypothetical protein